MSSFPTPRQAVRRRRCAAGPPEQQGNRGVMTWLSMLVPTLHSVCTASAREEFARNLTEAQNPRFRTAGSMGCASSSEEARQAGQPAQAAAVLAEQAPPQAACCFKPEGVETARLQALL